MHGRPQPKPKPRRRLAKPSGGEDSAAKSPGAATLRQAVDLLQGDWEDDIGLTIKIDGKEAVFSDKTGPWMATWEPDEGGAVVLRGARLVGDLAAGRPAWRFPHGVERQWSRPAVLTEEDAAWRTIFHSYKKDRLLLRRQLWAAVTAEDSSQTVSLKAKWKEEPACPQSASDAERGRIEPGRDMVPGMCFVHRRYGYRGVILACEPWCNAPAAWQEHMGVASLPDGKAQPFYHCIVDGRDRPGAGITFVAEENVQLTFAGEENLAFPVKSPLVDALFERCDKLSTYVPKPPLEMAIRRQQETNSPFKISGN